MFNCKLCIEKEKRIESLEARNKDLLDRLMAFNANAFTHYKAENKTGDPLFPQALDEDTGKVFSYGEEKPDKIKTDIYNAMGEEAVMVEGKK